MPRFPTLRLIFPHLVFWCWNAVFLSLAAFGVTPLVTAGLVAALLHDHGTLSLVAAGVLVVAVPLAATVTGALLLRRDPARLFRLFYAVEAPLFVLALARLFLIREVTSGVGYLLLAALAGVGAYLYRLLRDAEETRTVAVVLALAGDTLGLFIALYTAAFLAFFALPVGVGALGAALSFEWLGHFFDILGRNPGAALLVLLAVGLLLGSGTLFGLLPPALVVLYARRFRVGARWAASRIGVPRAVLVITLVSTALVGGAVASVRRPHRAAQSLLASPPENDAERLSRLAAEGRIRDGLRDAYLAPYRYLGEVGHAEYVGELWRDNVKLGPAGRARVQAAFDVVAAPFLFDGDMHQSATEKAGEAYKAFFDRSIQRAERASIVAALESTWNREEREAGLLAQGREKVHVREQDVRIVEARGDLAEIELHEVYENVTGDPQEVVYFFSLPETAALTGLWLGDTDDRQKAFAFTISPRGAAQRVYRNEVQRRRDPALLEQIGPRQYRLRAFPIPARTIDRARGRVLPDVAPGAPMHLWLRYRALAQDDAFPLPRLLEERNAFRDRDTRRSMNGRPYALAADAWLPASYPAPARVIPREHVARLDEATVVVATPEPAPTALPAGQRLAVVLDRSYSMRAHAAEAAAALDRLRALAAGNTLHLYLTSAPSRGEPPRRLDDLRAFDAASLVYYGGQDPADLLAQLAELRSDTAYDAILVLTDEGGLDLAGPKRAPVDLGAPVWMVHLGGQLAPGYDDATLETIQRRGGGAVTSLDEALIKLTASGDLGWADGYRFRVAREGKDDGEGFAAVAARRFIPRTARADGVAGLDAAHALAKQHGVVTAYSSMIVLVDEAQRQALRDAEAKADRFERATETGEQALATPPPAVGVTGTPEPEEWALLLVAAAGLAWMARSKLRRPVTAAA
jgi:putative PEP-CTERM system integral membrane protein